MPVICLAVSFVAWLPIILTHNTLDVLFFFIFSFLRRQIVLFADSSLAHLRFVAPTCTTLRPEYVRRLTFALYHLCRHISLIHIHRLAILQIFVFHSLSHLSPPLYRTPPRAPSLHPPPRPSSYRQLFSCEFPLVLKVFTPLVACLFLFHQLHSKKKKKEKK